MIKYIYKKVKEKYFFYLNRYYFIKNKVNFPETFRINGKIYISNKGKIEIGNHFKANSGRNFNAIGGDTLLRLIVMPGAELVIGEGVGISNSTIVVSKRVRIGNHVLIGGSCRIWDTDFHSLNPSERGTALDQGASKEILIGDNAFIGAGSIVLKGVSIGKNAVIGAGSVVTRNIPDNEIWGGNPARFIRKLNNFD